MSDQNERLLADSFDNQPGKERFDSASERQNDTRGYASLPGADSTETLLSTSDFPAITETSPPKDRLSMAYLIFFLFGVGMLFPWNIFITANKYFQRRFRGSPAADNFQNFFSVGSMMTNLISLCLVVFWGLGSSIKPMRKIRGSLLLYAAVFLLSAILTRIDEIPGSLMFCINLGLVVICGASTAYLQSGVFGLASLFPSIYVQAVMSGQGLAGAAVSLSQIITLMIRPDTPGEPNDPQQDDRHIYLSAFLYFLFALIVIVFCLAGSFVLQSFPFYQYHVQKYQQEEEPVNEKEEDDDLFDSPATNEMTLNTIENTLDSILTSDQEPMSKWQVMYCIRSYLISIFAIFFVTLSLFPSIVTLIESSFVATTPTLLPEESTYTRLFVPTVFLLFALGDWFGKSLPGFPALPLPKKPFGTKEDGSRRYWHFGDIQHAWVILVLSLLRIGFIPLFMICHVVLREPSTLEPRPSHVPYLIRSDLLYLVIVLVFAVSNGWLGSLAMMKAPRLLTRGKDKEQAGTYMVLVLTFGLFAGSLMGFVLRMISCGGCNPFVQ